jgi:hypothetical protein
MELTAFREKPHPEMRKRIEIEKNDDIVKRIGRSPDLAWGYFFAWAEPSQVLKLKRKDYLATRRRGSTRNTNRHYANVKR